MRLELFKVYPNQLNAHSEYGVSSSICITKVDSIVLL